MSKIKLTPEQKRALEAYRYAEKQEDRFFGSVFVNPISGRAYQEKTRLAYEACKRLGMDYTHGL
jgi:hypothetical protein